jgi:AcrR family transcriptional regulator
MARIKAGEREQVLGQTHEKLLEAAAAEFARKGFDAANINEISLAAGFAKGTVYNYFPSKRELILALIDETAVLHYDGIAGEVGGEPDPARRLERFFECGFGFITAHLARMRVMVNVIYGADMALKEHIFKAYQPLFAWVSREVIAYGVAAGRFRLVDPVAMGKLLLTIYLGTASHVTDDGFFFIKAQQVAEFARDALVIERREENLQG